MILSMEAGTIVDQDLCETIDLLYDAIDLAAFRAIGRDVAKALMRRWRGGHSEAIPSKQCLLILQFSSG